MVEKAIYLSDINRLKVYGLDGYDRIYFGNEFCDELIPSATQLKEAYSLAKENEKRFSFVTSYVSEYKINSYYKLLEILSDLAPGNEVIINDFGVLSICKKNNLTPVLGRVLARQRRDPRILDFIDSLHSLERLRLNQTGLNDSCVEFFKTQNINRLELDNLLQGIDQKELHDSNFHFSVYVPYGYIATGRLCSFRNKNKDEERFNIIPCRNKCAHSTLELYNKDIKEVLFIKGNTIFFKNTSEDFLSGNSAIDRVVFQPELPD